MMRCAVVIKKRKGTTPPTGPMCREASPPGRYDRDIFPQIPPREVELPPAFRPPQLFMVISQSATGHRTTSCVAIIRNAGRFRSIH